MQPLDGAEKRKWTRAETRAFLAAYLARKSEFDDPQERRNAWQSVLADLNEGGILTDHTTIAHLKVKLRSLMRSYKQSIMTGSAKAASQYFKHTELMNEIFEDVPMISARAAQLQSTPTKSVRKFVQVTSTSEAGSSSGAQPEKRMTTRQSANLSDTEAEPQAEQREEPRKSAKERYYERKIELLEQYLEGKVERHEAYLKQKEKSREERHLERMEFRKMKEEKKNLIKNANRKM